ncbi:MAG TPA: hypothetical protein VGP82_20560 [Ktedonobacterales bacterium]|nr:hypothetical protein [Ktedonobacterales bacterium]
MGIVTSFTNPEHYVLPLNTALVLLVARLTGDIADLPNPIAKIFDALGSARGRRRSDIGKYFAAGLLLVTLVTNFMPFMLVDAPPAMQSAFAKGNAFPTQNAELVNYLELQHIRYVWANQWIGDVVIYLSDQQVLRADYIDHVQLRFPEALAAVSAADRPRFILRLRLDAEQTAVEAALDKLGVTCRRARFGNLMIVTPLTRSVQPREILPALLRD